jgi:hypothetical protein
MCFSMCSLQDALVIEQVCLQWRGTGLVRRYMHAAVKLLTPQSDAIRECTCSPRSFRPLAQWITQNGSQATRGLRLLAKFASESKEKAKRFDNISIGERRKSGMRVHEGQEVGESKQLHLFPLIAEEMARSTLQELSRKHEEFTIAASGLAAMMGSRLRCVECHRTYEWHEPGRYTVTYCARYFLACGKVLSIQDHLLISFDDHIVPEAAVWVDLARNHDLQMRFGENQNGEKMLLSIQGDIMPKDYNEDSDFETLFDAGVLCEIKEALGLHCSDTTALYVIWCFLLAPRKWEDNGFMHHTRNIIQNDVDDVDDSLDGLFAHDDFHHFAEPSRFGMLLWLLKKAETRGVYESIKSERMKVCRESIPRRLRWAQEAGICTDDFDLGVFSNADMHTAASASDLYNPQFWMLPPWIRQPIAHDEVQ